MLNSEQVVIAGILPNFPQRVSLATSRAISEDNFAEPNLRMLWKHIDRHYDEHLAVIPEWVLKEKLEASESSGRVIGLMEVYRRFSEIDISESDYRAALDLLKAEEMARKTEEIILTSTEILRGTYYDERNEISLKGQDKAREYLSSALRQLESLETDAAPEGDIKKDTEIIWKEYLQREANPEDSSGILYGISEVDEFTGGVRAGELVLIAGHTASGKSHALTSLAWNAMLNKKNVLMFTTETTRSEMEIRVIARHSRLPQFKTPGGLDSHEIMNTQLSERNKEVFREVLTDFRDRDTGHLFMVQMPASGTVDYVHAKASQYNKQAKIDLILIDSINLLRMPGRYTGDSGKRVMLEDMLQSFKRFASSFDNGRGVAVVSPWQMSRAAWREALEAGGEYTMASLSDTSEAEKCLVVDSPVLTPSGFVPLNSLKPGDVVISGKDGTPTPVVAYHDNGNKPVYQLTTDDGYSVKATAGHKWKVYRVGTSHTKTEILTTLELSERTDQGETYCLALPSKTFQHGTVSRDELFSPEYLGWMLQEQEPTPGQLTLTLPTATNIIREMGIVPFYALRKSESRDEEGELTFSFMEEDLVGAPYYEILKEAGLFTGDKEKFRLPSVYLEAGPAVRTEMAKTFVARNGSPSYSLLGEQVQQGLKDLLLSLGTPATEEGRIISSVVDIGEVKPTACIEVKDGLFVTEGYMVTHNSASQIISIFKDTSVEPGRLNFQVLKNRSGREMGKVAYPYDYRNSFIGSSIDAAGTSEVKETAEVLRKNIQGLY